MPKNKKEDITQKEALILIESFNYGKETPPSIYKEGFELFFNNENIEHDIHKLSDKNVDIDSEEGEKLILNLIIKFFAESLFDNHLNEFSGSLDDISKIYALFRNKKIEKGGDSRVKDVILDIIRNIQEVDPLLLENSEGDISLIKSIIDFEKNTLGRVNMYPFTMLYDLPRTAFLISQIMKLDLSNIPKNSIIIDAGAGSGILALAAHIALKRSGTRDRVKSIKGFDLLGRVVDLNNKNKILSQAGIKFEKKDATNAESYYLGNNENLILVLNENIAGTGSSVNREPFYKIPQIIKKSVGEKRFKEIIFYPATEDLKTSSHKSLDGSEEIKPKSLIYYINGEKRETELKNLGENFKKYLGKKYLEVFNGVDRIERFFRW